MIAYDALLGCGGDWTELCNRSMFHGGEGPQIPATPLPGSLLAVGWATCDICALGFTPLTLFLRQQLPREPFTVLFKRCFV